MKVEHRKFNRRTREQTIHEINTKQSLGLVVVVLPDGTEFELLDSDRDGEFRIRVRPVGFGHRIMAVSEMANELSIKVEQRNP